MSSTALLTPFERTLRHLFSTTLTPTSLAAVMDDMGELRDLATYTEEEVSGYVWHLAEATVRHRFGLPPHTTAHDVLISDGELNLALDPSFQERAQTIIPARITALAAQPTTPEPF